MYCGIVVFDAKIQKCSLNDELTINIFKMHYLLKGFNKTKRNICELKSMNNVCWRAYRGRPEPSNLIKVAVIGSGSFGDPASLLIKTSDGFGSLFNCGEGTFRLMYARRYRFRFLSNVFCTRNHWERVGGIPSLARAVFDRNRVFPTFHSPPQLEKCLHKFAELTDIDPELAIKEHQFNSEPYYEDSHIQVDSVALNSTDAFMTKSDTVVAFVCRLRPRSGKVILSKFTQNNIPVEFIRLINNGEDITLPDGRTFLAKDLITNGFEGGNFLIMDIPSKEYLSDLERNELLNSHIDEINSNLGMEFVAHFTSSEIINTPEYQQFLRRINAKRHLAINETNIFSGLKHVHRMQKTLNRLDADIFPHLCSKFTSERNIFTNLERRNQEQSSSEPITFEPTTTGAKYIFSLNGQISENELQNNADDEEENTDSSGEDAESDGETEVHTTTMRANKFPKVVFFGTGSTFPGVTKTATAILVHTAPDVSILLDCGEGTVGQISRFYGDRTEDVIRGIKALHITHMHGDHHMGVMDLIRARQKYMPEDRQRLLLMAPKEQFGALLNFYEENFGNVCDEFIMIDNEDLINSGLNDDQKAMLKVNDVKTCRVPHLEFSYAISIKSNILPENKEEFKLTFSGDTIPCDSLVELGHDSTLLIHEATLEDTLSNSAAMKMHSTISQAIEQGQKMQAKHTVLTHFSQRYRVLPPINDELIAGKNIGIAFDNMEIVPDDLSKLNNLYFKLKETYAEELERVEKRSKTYAKRNDELNIMI